MSEQWVSLATARALVAQVTGLPDSIAVDLLINAMKNADITARADLFYERSSQKSERQAVLAPGFWDEAEPRGDDLSTWYCPTYRLPDDYRSTDRRPVPLGLLVKGIAVQRHEVSKLWPTAKTGAVNKGGTPGKWDWEGAAIHMARYAQLNDDSIPDRSTLNKVVADWFAERGMHPAPSEIRQHVKRFHDAVWPPRT